MVASKISVSKTKRIDVIQMLRGIAAIMVVMFHASAYQALPNQDNFARWLTMSGASGVDLFFCISGFIITYTTKNDYAPNPWLFALKRFCRIVPAYVLATLIFALAMWEVQHILQYHDYLYHLTFSDILQSFLFIPLNLSSADAAPLWGPPTLHVGWTLNYEMYFYAIFAISLFFGRKRYLFLFGWMIFTLIFIPLIFRHNFYFDAYHFYDWHRSYMNLMTSGMIWEFMVGVVIGLLYNEEKIIFSFEMAWILTISAVVITVWMMLNQVNPQFGPTRWGACYIVILPLLLWADNTVKFQVPKVLVWLGNISFSLYLVHPLVVEALGILLPHVTYLQHALNGMQYVFVLTALSVLAAYPMNKWVELRFSNYLYKKISLQFSEKK